MSQLVRFRYNSLSSTNGVPTPPARPEDALEQAIPQGIFGSFVEGDGNLCAETGDVRTRYREMMRDATVKASVLSKIWDIAALDLQMTPDDPDNERDKTIADFARDNVIKCKGGLRALVEALVFGPILEGYGLCHKVWGPAQRGKWAGKRMLQELRPKDSVYYDFVFDEFRRIVWVVNLYEEDETKRYLDPREFVIIRHLQIFDSPYGMSDLRGADRGFSYLTIIEQVRVVWLEKFKGPFLHGKAAAEVKESLLAKLKTARANGIIVTDPDTDIQIIDLATGSPDAYQTACNNYREEIATGITGSFLQMMAGQVGTQRGSSAVHADTAKLFRWYLSQLVCDAIDGQITPEAVDDNFAGNPPYPKAVLTGVDPEQVATDLAVGELLKTNGIPTSKKEWYKRSGWTPPIDDEDTIGGIETPDPFEMAGVGEEDEGAE